MATVLRVNLADIFLAIQAQLMASLGWPPERTLIVDPRKFAGHPQADQYLMIWLADQGSPDMPIFEGSGRVDTRITVRFIVKLWTRFYVDEVSSSLAWLTDNSTSPALGHLRAVGSILNALVGMVLTDTGDGTGNWLMDQCINPAACAAPNQPDSRDPEWGESVLGFVLIYNPDLDQTQG